MQNANVFSSVRRMKAARGSAGPGSSAGLRGMFKGCHCIAEEQTELIALVISMEVLEEVLILAHLRSGCGVEDPHKSNHQFEHFRNASIKWEVTNCQGYRSLTWASCRGSSTNLLKHERGLQICYPCPEPEGRAEGNISWK